MGYHENSVSGPNPRGEPTTSTLAGAPATPTIAKLASEGCKLEMYYVQPLCSPTRGTIMTGRYPSHTGIGPDVIRPSHPYGMPLSEQLLPQHFKDAGYAPAAPPQAAAAAGLARRRAPVGARAALARRAGDAAATDATAAVPPLGAPSPSPAAVPVPAHSSLPLGPDAHTVTTKAAPPAAQSAAQGGEPVKNLLKTGCGGRAFCTGGRP